MTTLANRILTGHSLRQLAGEAVKLHPQLLDLRMQLCQLAIFLAGSHRIGSESGGAKREPGTRLRRGGGRQRRPAIEDEAGGVQSGGSTQKLRAAEFIEPPLDWHGSIAAAMDGVDEIPEKYASIPGSLCFHPE